MHVHGTKLAGGRNERSETHDLTVALGHQKKFILSGDCATKLIDPSLVWSLGPAVDDVGDIERRRGSMDGVKVHPAEGGRIVLDGRPYLNQRISVPRQAAQLLSEPP